jgi:trimethylamine---corrinoid protein Co-methyltransferase
VDAQAGHEKTLTGLAAALAGTNLIYGPGMLDSGNTLDYAMMVVDDEIARMIRKFVAGVKVDDVTMAVDEICAIAPFSDYLSTDFTYAHMRELSVSNLLDRRVRMEWEADGKQDMRDRATAKAKEILAGHTPEPLPTEVSEELSAIVARCEGAAPATSRH